MELTFDPNPPADLDRIDDRELGLFDTTGDAPRPASPARGGFR